LAKRARGFCPETNAPACAYPANSWWRVLLPAGCFTPTLSFGWHRLTSISGVNRTPFRGTRTTDAERSCRMHGGKSPGAPRGNRNAWKHGHYSAESIALRRLMRDYCQMHRPRGAVLGSVVKPRDPSSRGQHAEDIRFGGRRRSNTSRGILSLGERMPRTTKSLVRRQGSPSARKQSS